MATLVERIAALAQAVAAQFKTLPSRFHPLNTTINLDGTTGEVTPWKVQLATDNQAYQYTNADAIGIYSTKYGHIVTFSYKTGIAKVFDREIWDKTNLSNPVRANAGNFTGDLKTTGPVSASSAFLASTYPVVDITQTDGPANGKRVQLALYGGQFSIIRLNDAGAQTDFPFYIMASGRPAFSQRPLFGLDTPWDSSNLPSPIIRESGTNYLSGYLTFKSTGTIGSGSFYPLLELQATTAADQPGMLVHRPGVRATYWGMDDDGDFFHGGFSDGPNTYKFWSRKNTPKATDSDLVAGTSTVAIPSVADVPGVLSVRPSVTSPTVMRIRDRLNAGSVDLREWSGIDYTGANDMTSTVQRAFNDAMREGYELVSRIPGILTFGSKLVTQTGRPLRFRSTIRPQISLFSTSGFDTKQPTGSACWLHFAHSDTGIQFDRGPDGNLSAAGVDRVFGNSLVGFGTYRDQGDPTSSSWTPVDAGFDVSLRRGGADIDIFTLNSSRLLELLDADKTTFSLRGQPLIEGIRALYNYDVIVGNDVEFWPYWSFHKNVKYFTSLTRVALRTARADGLYIKRLFDFQGFISHKVENAPQMTNGGKTYVGGTSYGVHTNYLYADSTSTAVQVDQGASNSYVSYDRLLYGPPDSGGLETDTRFRGRQTSGILVLAPYCDISIGSMSTAFAGASHIYVAGSAPGARVGVDQVIYGSWNRADVSEAPTAFPGFYVDPSASLARIELGFKQQLPTQVGSGGHVVDMRRAMPLMSGAVTDNARRGPDGNAVSPSFRASNKISAGWSLDGSDGSFSLSPGEVVSFSAGSGLIILSEPSTGSTGMVLLGGGLVTVVGHSGSTVYVSGSAPASGQIGIYFSGGTYVIKSNLSAATTMYLASIRNRPSA